MDSNASLKSPVEIPLKSECRYYIKESIDGTLLIYLGKIVLVKASPSSYPVNNFALYLNNVPIMTGQTINFHRKQVTFTRNAPSDQSHEPWYWTISVDD